MSDSHETADMPYDVFKSIVCVPHKPPSLSRLDWQVGDYRRVETAEGNCGSVFASKPRINE